MTSPVLKKQGAKRNTFKKHYMLYLLLLPTLVYLLIFSYYPMSGLVIAFKDWTVRGGIWGSPWASTNGNPDVFKHFNTLFSDPVFFQKLTNTLRISLLKLLIGFPLLIIVTILLNEMTSTKVAKVIQVFSYLPYFVSLIIISGILISMTSTGSSFQLFLKSIFGHEIHFFTDNVKFLGVIVVSDIWKNL